jgi:TRAP-type C4-dicarboxylate transport system substrate-binding protein
MERRNVMSRKWQILLGIFLTVVLVMGSGLAPAAIAASKKADYKFKWRMPQTMPVGDDHDLRALAFAKEVKEKTDGRIDITVYSGGVFNASNLLYIDDTWIMALSTHCVK